MISTNSLIHLAAIVASAIAANVDAQDATITLQHKGPVVSGIETNTADAAVAHDDVATITEYLSIVYPTKQLGKRAAATGAAQAAPVYEGAGVKYTAPLAALAMISIMSLL